MRAASHRRKPESRPFGIDGDRRPARGLYSRALPAAPRERGHGLRDYATRLDQFRVREALPLARWASEAGIERTRLGKYRAGTAEPHVEALARLVRAASRILGRPVRASELCDLGEDEPLGAQNRQRTTHGNDEYRSRYDTPFDEWLHRNGVRPNALARARGVSRQSLRYIRMGKDVPRLPTLRRIIIALRRRGHDVRAADWFDVGED